VGAEGALDFVDSCRRQQRYGLCEGLYRKAFEAEPALAEDLKLAHRFNAACFAAMTAAGKGRDSTELMGLQPSEWRGRARAWLRADLATWHRILPVATPEPRALARERLAHWLVDPDLATLRDDEHLAGLPESESRECREIWAEAAALLARARENP
jgi:hypothetical protein